MEVLLLIKWFFCFVEKAIARHGFQKKKIVFSYTACVRGRKNVSGLQRFYSYVGYLCVNNRAMEEMFLFAMKSFLNKIKNSHIVSFKSEISIWAEWKLSKHALVWLDNKHLN